MLLGLVLLTGGCGANDASYNSRVPGGVSGSAAPGSEAQYAEAAPTAASDSPVSDAAPPNVPRRIIYTAEVELTAERLTDAEPALVRLVKEHGGYLASSNVSGRPGEARSGVWKARVPVQRYDSFMAAVTRMGEVQRVQSDSQDVSAEYYDAKARLGNKRVEEQRLLDHLRSSTAKLSDILAVEKELSRVREEIEQIEGRLRVLTNQTELTTVTVTIHEIQGYVPPREANFGTQISRTFQESIKTLADFGKGLVLLAVGAVPWLVVILIFLIPLALVIRSQSRRRYPAAPPPTAQEIPKG